MKTQLHSPAVPARLARALAHLLARHGCLWATLGLAAMVFMALPAQAAVTEAWLRRYSNVVSNSYNQASKVVCDAAGDIIVTGITDGGTSAIDMLTIKYSGADGSVLWQKRYNGPANAVDFSNAVAVDGSGNVVVTGASGNVNDYPCCQDYDYYTAKYATADGALLWEQRYNGPGNYNDVAQAVTVDGSGNVVVTGSSFNTNFILDYYTAKYAAANGTLLWEKRYNGPVNGHDEALAVAVDGSGNVIVTGYSYNGTDSDYYTAKYATGDGVLLWEQRYNGRANDFDSPSAVVVDVSGNVVVSGYSRNSSGNADYYTVKYSTVDGALLWEKRCPGGGANAVAVDGSGNVVVAGSYGLYPNFDYYTAKYAAADGALLWEHRYNGPANGADESRAVAVDGSGNVVVTGYSDYAAPNFVADYYTAKYAMADGTLLWEQRYNGPGNGGVSLALGPNGMVAVTGTSSGDYATIVYRENLPPVSIALVPDGIRLRFTGVPGHSYTVERAPVVNGPWITINTQTAPPSGLLEYDDTSPPPGQAFYRAVQP